MIPPRSLLPRLLAALTPALLLWAFVGCAALCAEHAEEARGEDAAATSAELRDSHCSDPCPVSEATALVPAQRFTPDQLATDDQPAAVLSMPHPPRAASIGAHFSEVLRPPPDSPFERLRALRI